MSLMKNVLLLFLAIIILSSCKSDPVEEPENNGVVSIENVGEIAHVETLFDQSEFSSEMHFQLLKELNVCDTIEVVESTCATCTPDNFKIISFRNDKAEKDAFLLQVKALTVMKGQDTPLPMRHLIVFEREEGKLVKVNGFRGNLIATRESESGVKDLVVRFYIPDEGAFLNCLFVWTDSKYRFESVEAIHGAGGNGSVKESVKEEISKEVYQTLMSNAMLF